jgi:hypothetical protein
MIERDAGHLCDDSVIYSLRNAKSHRAQVPTHLQ